MSDPTERAEAIAAIVSRQRSTDNRPIGYLVNSKHVRCLECRGAFGVPLYRVNVDRYGQDCHECRAVLVTPATGWCELFTRDACGLCIDHLQEVADTRRLGDAIQSRDLASGYDDSSGRAETP